MNVASLLELRAIIESKQSNNLQYELNERSQAMSQKITVRREFKQSFKRKIAHRLNVGEQIK